jgi:hypothetical protein
MNDYRTLAKDLAGLTLYELKQGKIISKENTDLNSSYKITTVSSVGRFYLPTDQDTIIERIILKNKIFKKNVIYFEIINGKKILDKEELYKIPKNNIKRMNYLERNSTFLENLYLYSLEMMEDRFNYAVKEKQLQDEELMLKKDKKELNKTGQLEVLKTSNTTLSSSPTVSEGSSNSFLTENSLSPSSQSNIRPRRKLRKD